MFWGQGFRVGLKECRGSLERDVEVVTWEYGFRDWE